MAEYNISVSRLAKLHSRFIYKQLSYRILSVKK